MNVYDPVRRRQIWTQTLLEGDRDPNDPHSGMPWTSERGWFGTLALPRVLELGNISHDDGTEHFDRMKTINLPR
jgi:hypothetical protein